MERYLYNLKLKILTSKHISSQLKEELANDVFEIENRVNKTNETIDIIEEYKKTGYPIPKNEFDHNERQFDYWDMIAFAQSCADNFSFSREGIKQIL